MNMRWTYRATVEATSAELKDLVLWLNENIEHFDFEQLRGISNYTINPHNPVRGAMITFHDMADAAKFKLFFGGDEQ